MKWINASDTPPPDTGERFLFITDTNEIDIGTSSQGGLVFMAGGRMPSPILYWLLLSDIQRPPRNS